MKRKIFSKLLMGAFLIASISSFVSCKDYDDDIKDIKADMQKLALQTSIDNLQSQLTSAASTAQSALAKAEAAATQSALGDVKADLAAVQAAAKTAGENAAKGINDAAAAKSAADAAQGTADAAAVAAAAAGEAAKAAGDMAAQAQAAADKAQAAVDAAVAAGATKEAVAAVEAEAKKAAEAAEAAAKAAEEKAAAAQSAAEATAKSLAAAAQADAVKAANAYTDAAIAAIKADIAKISFEEKDEKAMAAIKEIQAQVGKIATLEAEVAKIAGLSQGLDDLKAQVAALQAASDTEEFTKAMTALTAKVDGYQASIDAMFSAVTSVEIFATYFGTPTSDFVNKAHGQALVVTGGTAATTAGTTPGTYKTDMSYVYTVANNGHVVNLPFWYGMQKTSVFGDEPLGNVAADNQIAYDSKKYIEYENGIVIRVNPVNVEIKAEDVLLINSNGEALDDLVEIGTPVRFSDVITRGSTINTGLWKIPFSLKDGVSIDDFNVVVYKDAKKDKDGKVNTALYRQLAYAIAINNTSSVAAGEDRYVASTWDIVTNAADFVGANFLNFTVDNVNVNAIHNRWDGIQVHAEDNTISSKNPEYVWINPNADQLKAGVVVPTTEPKVFTVKKADDTPNTQKGDNRFNQPVLVVEEGKDFEVKITNTLRNIQYFYVVLDEKNAIESNPSEINAWKSYSISNLGVMNSALEVLPIKISGTNAKGDIVGFRVFAVNFDGTLVDPDGKAFYVKVAGEKEESTVPTVSATADAAVSIPALEIGSTNNPKSDAIAIDGKALYADGTGAEWSPFVVNPTYFNGNATTATTVMNNTLPFTVYFYSDAAGTKDQTTTFNANAKSFRIAYDPQALGDGLTYNKRLAVTVNTNSADASKKDTIQYITFSMTKVLPTTLPADAKVALAEGIGNNNIVTAYVSQGSRSLGVDSGTGNGDGFGSVTLPTGATVGNSSLANSSDGATFSLNGLFQDLADTSLDGNLQLSFAGTDSTYTQPTSSNPNYYINFAGSKAFGPASAIWNNTITNAYELTYNARNTSNLWIQFANKVDNTTQHAVNAVYNYGNISRPVDKNGVVATATKAFTKSVDTGIRMIYATWDNGVKYGFGVYRDYNAYTPTGSATVPAANATAYLTIRYGANTTAKLQQRSWDAAEQKLKNSGTINFTLQHIRATGGKYPGWSNITFDNLIKATAALDKQLQVLDIDVFADAKGTTRSGIFKLNATDKTNIIAGTMGTGAIKFDFIGNTDIQYTGGTQYLVIKAIDWYDTKPSMQNWDRTWGQTGMSYEQKYKDLKVIALPITITRNY